MLVDRNDLNQLELMASIAYQYSFSCMESDGKWEATKLAAKENGGYAKIIVDRCYKQAKMQLTMLRRYINKCIGVKIDTSENVDRQ